MRQLQHIAAAVTATTATVLLMTACSPQSTHDTAKSSTAPAATPDAQASSAAPAPTATQQRSEMPPATAIAKTRGDDGIVGEIYRVERRDGMVTVWAGARNDGDKDFYASAWTDEGTGYTLAGSSIVDRKGGKRYLALKDSQGNCLCTEIKRIIEPGETRPLYATFQAPPESTTEVDLQLGNMQPVRITLPAGQ
ncbi:hypothetical protein [Streptomyces sp. EKS3.2]|uniref:hypothetical protein n=1 Tax=Streptomyces sp. EKS3.2 TaxID=3461008 RepID=UPI0040427651